MLNNFSIPSLALTSVTSRGWPRSRVVSWPTENVTIEKLRRLLEMEEFVMALQNGEDAVLT